VSGDCQPNGVPDDCESAFWDPDVFGGSPPFLFSDPANWLMFGGAVQAVPLAWAEIDAGFLGANTCLFDAGPSPCLTIVRGQPGFGAIQTLELPAGRVLDTDLTVELGGVVDLNGAGAGLSGLATVLDGGEVRGWGTVDADLTVLGLLEADEASRDLLVSGAFSCASTAVLSAVDGGQLRIVEPDQDLLGDVQALHRTMAASKVELEGVTTTHGDVCVEGSTLDAGQELVNLGNLLALQCTGTSTTITAATSIENQGYLCAPVGAPSFIAPSLINTGTIEFPFGAFINANWTGGGTFNAFIATPCSPTKACPPSPLSVPTLTLVGDFSPGKKAALRCGPGTFQLLGSFDVAINDPSRFDLDPVSLVLLGTVTGLPQEFEAMSPEVVPGLPVLGSSFPIGTLRVTGNPFGVKVVNRRANSGNAREAVWVKELILDPGAVLDLNGHDVYYGTVSPADPCNDPSVTIQGCGRLLPLQAGAGVGSSLR